MKRILFLLINILLLSAYAHAQAPPIQWQKRFGGQYSDGFKAICQTTDGGYVAAGLLSLPAVAFSYNFWIVKTDSLGNPQWQKSYGGFVQDYANTIVQTADGGYIIGGRAGSGNGDVTGYHGGGDTWILKLDATGNVQWKRCYGGSMSETISKLLQLPDGSYIAAGSTASSNGDLTGTGNNNENAWLLHLDASGNIMWQKLYGGSGNDGIRDIKVLPGGGFIAACISSSNNGDVTGNHGGTDYWIFRADVIGNILWQKSLGGSHSDIVNGISLSGDGGFVAAGFTESTDGDISGFHGGVFDTWIVKLDASGNLLWQKTLGGSASDMGMSITTVQGNIFVIAGSTKSVDGDVTHVLGQDDLWLAALDNTGQLVWENSYGGSDVDGYSFDQFGMHIIATADGGLAVATMTGSPEVPGGNGGWDGYILKLKKPQCDTISTIHDTSFCTLQPVSVTLQPAHTANIYTWNTTAQTAAITVHDTGTFWRVATSGCNLYTDSFYLHHATGTKSYNHDTLICRGTTMELVAGTGFDHYMWSTGDTTASITAPNDGVYWRRATDACRTVTDSFNVWYKKALPVPQLGPDRELCSDTHPQIGAFYEEVQYRWNTGETTAYIHPGTTGMYMMSITNGCETAQDSIFVKVYDCNDCLFVPSAFTPNADGRNDAFGARAKCAISNFRMNIYNRWGQMIFVAYNTDSKWDGTYNGSIQPVGVYYYGISYVATDGRTVHVKGDVTLIL